MNDLVKEYKESLQLVRKAKQEIETIRKHSAEANNEYSVLSSMERDLKWSIEWMETGCEPQKSRGVERLAGYQRECSVDPFILASQEYTVFYPQISNRLTKNQMIKLEQVFSKLSKSERNAYMMSRGNGLTYREIALLLHVKKGTIQKLVERAEKKIKDNRRMIEMSENSINRKDSNLQLSAKEQKRELKRLLDTEGLMIRTSPSIPLDQLSPEDTKKLYEVVQCYLKEGIPKSI